MLRQGYLEPLEAACSIKLYSILLLRPNYNLFLLTIARLFQRYSFLILQRISYKPRGEADIFKLSSII